LPYLFTKLSSGVPGELRGLQYLHENYGSMPWEDLIRPSVEIARHGFPIDESLVEVFNGVENPEFLTKDPAWAVDFAPNGTLLGLGDILTRKRLASVLERIAIEGPDVFYEGDIAEATIRALQAKNGIMTLKDLKDYRALRRQPITIDYHDFRITSLGAPSGGSVVLSVLKTVERYQQFGDNATLNISTHRLDEAIRFSFGAVSNPRFRSRYAH